MRTKPRIYVGTDSFAKLLLESNVFVDKSLLIQEFLEESGGDVVLITRPRRWGKSLNMDMLRCFLEIAVDEHGVPLPQAQCLSHKLFAGGEVVIAPRIGKVKQLAPLKIAQQCPELVTEYQGQYPVISLGLKDVKGITVTLEALQAKWVLLLFELTEKLCQEEVAEVTQQLRASAFITYVFPGISSSLSWC